MFSKEAFAEDTIKYCTKSIEMESKKAAHSYVHLAKAYSDLNNEEKEKSLLRMAAKKYLKSEFVQWAAGNFYLKKNGPG